METYIAPPMKSPVLEVFGTDSTCPTVPQLWVFEWIFEGLFYGMRMILAL